MASVRHEIVIDSSPEHVWDVLRDVGAVHERLLPGRVADSRVEGGQRLLTFPDGHVIRELIVAVDDGTRRLAYSIIEGARPPADYHHASFEVLPEGRWASRLIWTTDVLPHALAARIRIIMERGAMQMKEAIEAAAPQPPTATPGPDTNPCQRTSRRTQRTRGGQVARCAKERDGRWHPPWTQRRLRTHRRRDPRERYLPGTRLLPRHPHGGRRSRPA
jgi:hypothetical protein